MTAIRELYLETNGCADDNRSNRWRTRVYRADTPSKEAAEIALASLGITIGGADPDDGTLLCDRIESVQDNGTRKLTAVFTNNGRGSSRFVTRDDNFIDHAPTKRRATWKFPYFESVMEIDAGSATTVEVWRPKVLLRPLVLFVYQLSVVVPRLSQDEMFDIADQEGHIHKGTNGRYYLFEGGDSVILSDSRVEITYQWVLDRGNQLPLPDPTGQNFWTPSLDSDYRLDTGQNSIPVGRVRRLPFEQIELVQNRTGNGAGSPGTFISYNPYQSDDNGWLGLPGSWQLR